MKTNDAVTMICNVAPYMYDLVDSIKRDNELIQELKEHKNDKVYLLFKIAPKLLKVNPNAMYSIIGELSGKTAEEVANQSIGITLNQLKKIGEDEDIRSFFTAFGITTITEEVDVEK